MAIFQGGVVQLIIFRMRVILRGNFLWWKFSGWKLSGGNHAGGNFPGGSFHCYQILKLYKNKIKLATLKNKKGNICLNNKKVTCLKDNKISTCKWQKYIISLFFNFKSNFYIFQMESVPIFPAFNILVNSSQSSQNFRYEFGHSNIGAHIWVIGRLAKPFIALKEASIFSIIIMALPVKNRNNLIDSKSSKLRIYYIKNI